MKKWIKRKPRYEINKGKDLLSQLANIRGIPVKQVDDFLMPEESVLKPTRTMKNALETAERIKYAIENDQNIVVSMDNDADGVTSTAIMIRYLKERMDKEIPYIFAERDWGHGIKEQLMTKAESVKNEERNENAERNRELIRNADLLIIVDSSSNDVETCKKIIESYETDIIILDHHEITKRSETMADVGVMLVNPQQEGCEYENKGLSGAGVVYKMVELVEELFDDGLVDTEKFLDLTAVGLVGDMMPMNIPENRYMVSQGLLNIHNMGLERIIKSGNNSKTDGLTSDIIGFTVAPLINGTARMGNIEDAILLLLSDEDKEVKRIRLRMHKANEARKLLQREIVDKVSQDIDPSMKMIFVVTDESNRGMNGLVAQSLVEKYKRPVFVGRKKDDMIMGSARSYNNIQLKTFFGESGLVELAEGHEGALGLNFKVENLESIMNYVEINMSTVKQREEVSMYDIHLETSELEDAIDLIESFNHITGTDCKKVIVRIDDLMVEERNVIGSLNNTVKIKTMDNVDILKFRVNEEYADEIGIMDSISIVGELKWNIWTQFKPVYTVHKTMQVLIDDYRMEE